LGLGDIGGTMLKHPASGRLASSIKAETNPDGNVVAIYIDPDAEAELVKLSGHKAYSLKNRLLRVGKPGTKRSKSTGYLYRYVPISDPPAPGSVKKVGQNWLKNFFTTKSTTQGGIMSINRNVARMWATAYQAGRGAAGGAKIRTMSNKPGSAAWKIPKMPAYNVKKLLREMLDPRIRDRVI
jgi:hypothetical protein